MARAKLGGISIRQLSELVAQLERAETASGSVAHIVDALFPRFKSLAPGAKITFPLRLTAIVGANGSGKSSVLHALYGMPMKYSTRSYWFSTSLDPIDESGEPQRYIYSHYLPSEKQVVQTRKARTGAKKDYWEPTRAAEGMVPPTTAGPGRSKDRWDPIQKTVLYVNFRFYMSAFDRVFHLQRAQTKEDRWRLLKWAADILRAVIDGGLSSYVWHGKDRIVSNKAVDKDAIEAINWILGTDYKSITIVEHLAYRRGATADSEQPEVSIQIGAAARSYSDAFAGSGETGVIRAVCDILGQPSGSLLLLDEPETSLHPAAQKRFLRFLLQTTLERSHQTIIATHSPSFIAGLPPRAIRVVESTTSGATFLEDVSPHLAFHRIGHEIPALLHILVEDEIAKCLVDHAVSFLDPADGQQIEVQACPGGANTIWSYHTPVLFELEGRSRHVLVFLDGDQRPSVEETLKKAEAAEIGFDVKWCTTEALLDPDLIPAAQDGNLEQLIQLHHGKRPPLLLESAAADRTSRLVRLAKHFRSYLAWIRDHLTFLPGREPEQLAMQALGIEFDAAKDPKSAFSLALEFDTEPNSDRTAIFRYKLKRADQRHVRAVLGSLVQRVKVQLVRARGE